MSSNLQSLTVGVIVPAYNAAEHICSTLAALEDQTRPPDHVVIVDDGSSDQTGALVANWSSGTRIRTTLIQQSNGGVSSARNRALAELGTDLCAPVDADDLPQPDHLECLSSAFERHPDLVIAFGDQEIIHTSTGQRFSFLSGKACTKISCAEDSHGFRVFTESVFAHLLHGNFIPTSASMYRASVARAIGEYDTRLTTSEDREFLLRLCRHGAAGFFPRTLAWKREGHPSLTSRASIRLVSNSLLCLLFIKEKLNGDELSGRDQHGMEAAISAASQNLTWYLSKVEHSRRKLELERIRGLTGFVPQLSLNDRIRSLISLVTKPLYAQRILNRR